MVKLMLRYQVNKIIFPINFKPPALGRPPSQKICGTVIGLDVRPI